MENLMAVSASKRWERDDDDENGGESPDVDVDAVVQAMFSSKDKRSSEV